MASIVYFYKIADRPEVVLYVFGDDPDTMIRTLSIDKTDQRSSPSDGNIDYGFLKASRKIHAKFAETGAWPERGMSVS